MCIQKRERERQLQGEGGSPVVNSIITIESETR